MQTLETGCKTNFYREGFTLIEILVVLIIIGIGTSLISLNFSTLNSINKQAESIEETFVYLTEESIVTGRVIGWYVSNESHFASFINKKNSNDHIYKKKWSNSYKKFFRLTDGSKIEIGANDKNIPILLFYPSGENSGGILEIQHNEFLEKIILNNNAEIISETIKY